MLNGIFKNTSSDEIWHPKDILHEYMNACLSEGGNYNSNLRTAPWIGQLEKCQKNMKDAEALLMEVIYEKEKMVMYFNFQEREKNVIASSPWIDEVYEPPWFYYNSEQWNRYAQPFGCDGGL